MNITGTNHRTNSLLLNVGLPFPEGLACFLTRFVIGEFLPRNSFRMLILLEEAAWGIQAFDCLHDIFTDLDLLAWRQSNVVIFNSADQNTEVDITLMRLNFISPSRKDVIRMWLYILRHLSRWGRAHSRCLYLCVSFGWLLDKVGLNYSMFIIKSWTRKKENPADRRLALSRVE